MVKLNIELPDHFYEEEVRSGYTVSADMKKIWAVELDLLNEFMRVCRKHDIKFFAAGGTILGAVRHKGFIPWDDDIDVMMMRSEYNRLCAIAPKEFKHPYFFQTEETDPGSFRGHAQLRNSETTGILKFEYHQKKHINQGIFIDIFPLDFVPDDVYDRKDTFSRIKWYTLKCNEQISLMYRFHFVLRKNLLALFYNMVKRIFTSKKDAAQKANDYYNIKEQILASNKKSGHLLMAPFFIERWCYPKDDLNETVSIPFEMLMIPVPKKYESVLDKTYGNWRTFVVGGSVHGGVIFDTERSYTEYL